MLAEAANRSRTPPRAPKALIVPHAGYQYSGAVAASAYHTLMSACKNITRVVLLGPAHRVRVEGIAASGADYFNTPLGNLPVDTDTVRQCVTRFPYVSINNSAHREEHSLETQLPFLQRCLGQFKLVPFVVGAASPEQVAKCLDFLWGGAETLILISSDLSHFHPYADARALDSDTTDSIVSLNPRAITYEHACGQLGVRGLLQLARRNKLSVEVLDVRNSGDTSGRMDQVVGYGSYAFFEPHDRINRRQRRELTRVAWAAIDHGLRHGKMWTPDLTGYGAVFTEPGSSFVTLKDAQGRLRGCIGTLQSDTPLLINVAHNAYKAAFRDGRFAPLKREERAGIRVEMSVLGPTERIDGDSEDEILGKLHPFADGVILIVQGKRATFLPTVWESIPSPVEFLRQLKKKAGLDPGYWDHCVEIYRYNTESW